jgi:hypothetical protein
MERTETPLGFTRETLRNPKARASRGRGTSMAATSPARSRSRSTSSTGRAPPCPAITTRAPSARSAAAKSP